MGEGNQIALAFFYELPMKQCEEQTYMNIPSLLLVAIWMNSIHPYVDQCLEKKETIQQKGKIELRWP